MEEGMSQWLADISLTFGFLKVEWEALTLPAALTLPSIIRKDISTFLMGLNLPSSSDKAPKDRPTKALADQVEPGPTRADPALGRAWNQLCLLRVHPGLLRCQSQEGQVGKPTCSQVVPMGNYYECLYKWRLLTAPETLSKGLGQVVLDMKVAPKTTQLLPHGDTDPNGEVKQRSQSKVSRVF